MKRILASLLVLLALASSAGAADYTIRGSAPSTTLQSTDSFQFQRNNTGPYYYINKSDLITALGLSYTNISGLSTVAHTGAYGDLSGRPSLATVATSGLYSDLSGLPTLGTAAAKAASDNTKSALASVSGATTSGHVCTFADSSGTVQDGGALVSSVAGRSGAVTLSTSDVSGYVAPVNADWNASTGLAQILNKPALATVATSGAYGDLSGTPTIDTLLPAQTGNSGKFYSTNGTTSGWASIPGGVSNLSQLGDVSLGTLSDGQFLKYVGADSKWENATLDLSGYVPTTRTVAGHALSSNVTIACGDLSNAVASCSTDATNASNISSGTLGAGRLPNPSATTLGGVESIASSAHNFLTSISTSGVPAKAQPACADISDAGTVCTHAASDFAASGANTDITSLLLNQTGLVIKGADSNALTIKDNETLTAGRTLNLKVNDAARTVDLSGNLTVSSAATVSGTNTGDQTSVTGNAGTATALAANGANCSAGQFAAGVDASGASEGCTALPTTITGTTNQITASASTGAITLSTPQDIGTGSSPQFAGINVGNATDTTITRTGAGDIAVEGNGIYRAGGTDVATADGGTGSSTTAGALANLGASNAAVAPNAQTGTTYTLVLGDGLGASGTGGGITLSNASAITLTVPPNSSVAFPTGTQITACQIGAGQVTVAAGAGVTLHQSAATLKLRAQYSCVTLWKYLTDTWLVSGDLAAS